MIARIGGIPNFHDVMASMAGMARVDGLPIFHRGGGVGDLALAAGGPIPARYSSDLIGNLTEAYS